MCVCVYNFSSFSLVLFTAYWHNTDLHVCVYVCIVYPKNKWLSVLYNVGCLSTTLTASQNTQSAPDCSEEVPPCV